MSATYLKQSAFAKLCGVSRQAVGKAIKEGRIILTTRGIDPAHPSNAHFRVSSQANKVERAQQSEMKTRLEEVKKKAPKKKTKKKTKKKVPTKQTPVQPPAAWEETGDIFVDDTARKLKATAKKEEAAANLAILKYARELEVVIDADSLKQKMGAFMDVLLTEFVYMPEVIADLLWSAAKASSDPEREIREILSKQIGEAIQKAKKAAATIQSPDSSVKYVLQSVD